MDEGGEWTNDAWADSRPACMIKLQFQRFGARSRILGRRNGFVRGAYGRLVARHRFLGNSFWLKPSGALIPFLLAEGARPFS